MKINIKFRDNSDLIMYSKLPYRTLFVMPGNGIGTPHKLFIKLNDSLAIVFDNNEVEEVEIKNNVWVKQVVELDIDVTVKNQRGE